MRDDAIRIMKEEIMKNPAKVSVFDTWQTVQEEMTRGKSEDCKDAFLEKLGKFEDIAKSLYNIKRASFPSAPKDILDFDTTLPWFDYESEFDVDEVPEKYVLADEYHRKTGRVVMFGITESLTNLARGRGILVDGTFKGKFAHRGTLVVIEIFLKSLFFQLTCHH